ncbi:MAG: class I SAM-dependent methyltransferase [Acidobacteria bacterium]|nr:class I SAM-dependent methyltransferase [Acidobacteriota bacterium]
MTWIDAVRRRTPRTLFPLARTLYHRLVVPVECAAATATDRLLHRTYEGRVLPPAALRFKVRGTPSGDVFARVGRDSARQIDDALGRGGRSLADDRAILDFGCGCGGTLTWVRELAPQAALSGTDIDGEAIAWCRAQLPWAAFGVNAAQPPLPYADAAFELVYALSVFTHLDEAHQRQWLAELRRVIAPGGTCLVTLHGPDTATSLSSRDRQRLTDHGFAFVRTNATRGLFPEWYQNAYHEPWYVQETFAEYFDVGTYVPRGLIGHQDIVVLSRRAD